MNAIIRKSGLAFLNEIEFVEVSSGRFFQKDKVNIGNGLRYFYVILGPNIESPIHNHKEEKIAETHVLLFGSGKFIVYDNNNSKKEIVLERGKFHKIFSDLKDAPNHKYIAGPDGSITLALERFI